MPYFTSETEEGTGRTSEEIALMNTRYDQQVEDVEPVNEETGQTEESRSEEIEGIIDEIRSDMGGASEEEIALLYHLYNEGVYEYWLDDFRVNPDGFYQSPLIDVGHGTSEQWGVIFSGHIEGAFKIYAQGWIDEYVLPTIPERYRLYFDSGAFIHDMELEGGYSGMSPYDGNYEEVTIGGQTWYLFRVN
jgi:hypothetical protein